MRYPSILLALALLVSIAIIAFSEVSIDYSHNIKGSGTIVTDYRIGDQQNTEVSGKVRGTGDMMNKYLFESNNNTGNVTFEDEFVMSRRSPTNTSRPTLASYPQIPNPNAPNIVFTGTAWAEKITLPISFNGLNLSSKSNGTTSAGH